MGKFGPKYQNRQCKLKFVPKKSKSSVEVEIWYLDSVCFPLPPSAGGVEPPTKFSKKGTWQDLSF